MELLICHLRAVGSLGLRRSTSLTWLRIVWTQGDGQSLRLRHADTSRDGDELQKKMLDVAWEAYLRQPQARRANRCSLLGICFA